MNAIPRNSNDDVDNQPPILKTWNRLYTIVILNLAFLIVLFYIFSKVFE